MRLPLFCMTCQIEQRENKQPVKIMEVRDDGRYITVCDNGHDVIVILQQLKFEVLFEIGAYAIADGYYREAVSSFTSSLERFYEFVIRAILHAKGVPEAEISNAWKAMSRQSERQLGAFMALYATEFSKAPKVLSSTQVEFRNDVIHRGKIPIRDEAIRYGQAILDLVRPDMRRVQKQYPHSVQKLISDHVIQSAQKDAKPNQLTSTMGLSTIICLAAADQNYDERLLEDAVSTLIRWEEPSGQTISPR